MFANSRQVEIEWGDCDPAGIVYFPRYFAMFDTSTAHLITAALGGPKRDWLRQYKIAGIPSVTCSAEFLSPCSFGDVVTIESRIARLGRSSFEVAHRLTGPAGPAVEASEKRVWTARAADGELKAVPLPAAVVAAFKRSP